MTGDAGLHLFWRRSTSFLAQVNFFSGTGQQLFWCRSTSFLAQVGFLGRDLRHPWAQNRHSRRRSPPFFLTCAKTPLHLRQEWTHLRQKSATPAPSIDLTCHTPHVQVSLVQWNGLQAQIPCTSLSGNGPKRPIDGKLEHKTAL